MIKPVKYSILIAIVLAGLIALDHALVKKNPDVLNASLTKLGDKFMELVPEGGEKVKTVFDQFVKSVEAKEVDPDQVEQIAANIINLRNQNVTLTPEQAESVISVGYLNPNLDEVLDDSTSQVVAADSADEAVIAMEEQDVKLFVIPAPPSRVKPIDPERFEILGVRLNEAFELNDKIQIGIQANKSEEAKGINKHIQILIKDGVKLTLDTELKNAITEINFERLNRELKDLERDKRIEWRENMAREMERESKNIETELEELHELKVKHRTRIKALRFEKALSQLEHLKYLETKGYKPVVNPDSIRLLIEKKIQEEYKKAEKHKDKHEE